MEAVLKFDLSNYDDVVTFKRTMKADDMAMVLWHITTNMKKEIEWAIDNNNLSGYDVLEMVYNKINDLLEDGDITPSKLIE